MSCDRGSRFDRLAKPQVPEGFRSGLDRAVFTTTLGSLTMHFGLHQRLDIANNIPLPNQLCHTPRYPLLNAERRALTFAYSYHSENPIPSQRDDMHVCPSASQEGYRARCSALMTANYPLRSPSLTGCTPADPRLSSVLLRRHTAWPSPHAASGPGCSAAPVGHLSGRQLLFPICPPASRLCTSVSWVSS